MYQIFDWVYKALLLLAHKTKRTYNEINILVYFFFVPFTWCILIDIATHKVYATSLFLFGTLIFFVRCKKFRSFSNKLFNRSVQFLNAFQPIGINYTVASVIFCVFLPLIIYGFLLYAILST